MECVYMGLASESLQLSSTTLCEHYCLQRRDFRRKSRPKTRLSHPAASFVPHRISGYPIFFSAGAHSDDHIATRTDDASSLGHLTGIELPELGPCKGRNKANSAPDVGLPDDATSCGTGMLDETDNSNDSVLSSSPFSAFGPSDGHSEQLARSSEQAREDVLSSARPLDRVNLPPLQKYNDPAASDVSTSNTPASIDAKEEKGKIRRFSLNESALQETKPLSPPDKVKLDTILRYKLTNNNVKGKLVIRAVRTEQLKDLEDLLTDSYSELMWGPLTYKPALAWVLRTYLRERQACLPLAVTLVGLYNPLEETSVDQGSDAKWWLAGAAEVSFNASGRPKDMQTPLPPGDAPFLSNMAVLKKFRRRGIGRELLKAAEELTMQMGGSEMYLHCRMVDEAPLNMYKSSGYSVVDTDSLLSLLLFQRRRHLMYKKLEGAW